MAATVESNGKLVRNCYRCTKCRELFYCTDFDYDKAKTACCPGTNTHVQGTAELMVNDTGSGEKGWKFCKYCAALYYASSATAGTCVGGGSHVAVEVEFTLTKVSSGSDSSNSWAKCGKCACLYQRGGGTANCAKGASHEAASTDSYTVNVVPKS